MDDFDKLETLKLSFDTLQAQQNSWYNGHQDRCSIQCVRFARRIRNHPDYKNEIDALFIKQIKWGARLHDIGKASIEERVLNKVGRLSKTEWLIIKAHPENGADIIDSVKPKDKTISNIVRFHQEKWDGSGYPDGIKECTIPLGARMLKIIDTLDSMTNNRPYREVYSVHDALIEMDGEVGKSFDPLLYSLFRRMMEG